MQFILVSMKADRTDAELHAYLYAHTRDTGGRPAPFAPNSRLAVLEVVGGDAGYQADRLASGLYGARIFDTLADLDAHVARETAEWAAFAARETRAAGRA